MNQTKRKPQPDWPWYGPFPPECAIVRDDVIMFIIKRQGQMFGLDVKTIDWALLLALGRILQHNDIYECHLILEQILRYAFCRAREEIKSRYPPGQHRRPVAIRAESSITCELLPTTTATANPNS